MSQNISKFQELSDLAAKSYSWRALCVRLNSDRLGYDEFTEYELDGKRYLVNASNHVFYEMKKGDTYELEAVTNPDLMAGVLNQSKEDKRISSARDEIASVFSAKDPLLTHIFRIHLEYNGGRIDSAPLEKEGVKFYQVGRNASHMFYLGVKDGKMYQYATDGGYWDEEKEKYIEDDSEVYEVDPNNIGYIGHF